MDKEIQVTEIGKIARKRILQVKPWYASKNYEEAFIQGFLEGSRAILEWSEKYLDNAVREAKESGTDYMRGKRHGVLQMVRTLDDLFEPPRR